MTQTRPQASVRVSDATLSRRWLHVWRRAASSPLPTPVTPAGPARPGTPTTQQHPTHLGHFQVRIQWVQICCRPHIKLLMYVFSSTVLGRQPTIQPEVQSPVQRSRQHSARTIPRRGQAMCRLTGVRPPVLHQSVSSGHQLRFYVQPRDHAGISRLGAWRHISELPKAILWLFNVQHRKQQAECSVTHKHFCKATHTKHFYLKHKLTFPTLRSSLMDFGSSSRYFYFSIWDGQSKPNLKLYFPWDVDSTGLFSFNSSNEVIKVRSSPGECGALKKSVQTFSKIVFKIYIFAIPYCFFTCWHLYLTEHS